MIYFMRLSCLSCICHLCDVLINFQVDMNIYYYDEQYNNTFIYNYEGDKKKDKEMQNMNQND